MPSGTKKRPAAKPAGLSIATCQFPVEADIASNKSYVLRQMRKAARMGARVVHFSECALSGYAGVEFDSLDSLDWVLLKSATQDIMQLANELNVWVLLGSTHQLTGNHKPHNCVYVINGSGEIVERYDKRFCTGIDGRNPTLDLIHYSPGNHMTIFEVDGFKCGILICYDYRFPELYRELQQSGVQVLFQSFHNARASVVADQEYNIWKTIVPSTMACRAAENHIWISANNSTAYPSRWGSFLVRPDGAIVNKLPLHKAKVMVNKVFFDDSFYDAPGPWRDRAVAGILHSGCTVRDKRSSDRTII
ncbi:MAG: carbon-nitrogen hydrolase family protein [Planctomycetaceae bacterium]